jgi:SAM-dependent methyltransferase
MSYDDIATEYDAAFAWESDPDVILPVWRQLGSPSRVIEFACGPARLLSTLVANGVFGIGVDISRPMLELARVYLGATGGAFELHEARLEDFEVNAPVGGALCAAGSFGHLATQDAAFAHLSRARDVLEESGRYGIQLSLKPIVRTEGTVPDASMGWEFELEGETLRYIWYGTGIDPDAKQEVQRSRIEWLTGPRRGEIAENDHLMSIWDWARWSDLIRAAGFEEVSALDARHNFQVLQLGPDLHGYPQAWHVLAPA